MKGHLEVHILFEKMNVVTSLMSCNCADELRGLILLDATLPKAWERVALLKFGQGLNKPPTHHVYLEVQGR